MFIFIPDLKANNRNLSDSLKHRLSGMANDTAFANFPIALDYYFKMLEILDNEASGKYDTLQWLNKRAALNKQIGTCYFNMDNNTKALEYYLKSLGIIQEIALLDPKFPANEKLAVLYTNIGSAHLSSYNFNEAKNNFEKALEMNRISANQAIDGMLFNNLGIVYKEYKDFKEAFKYYDKALAIRLFLRDTAAIAQTYNNMGDAYYLTGNFTKAIDLLTKALEMSRQTGILRSQMKAANFLSLAYEKTGDFAKALGFYKTYTLLHDSIISNEAVQNTTRLELQYQYEKQRKENELQQEILVAKKERKALIYMVLSGVLLFSFLILFLLNRNQRLKMRQGKMVQESLELERKNLTLEKQNLRMELDFRNKELSTHVLYLLRKNEFISSIINKLLSLKKSRDNPENDQWIQDILREMQSNLDNTVWSEFEMRFQQVHQDFYQKLLEKYPDLTPNEIKICAFLKLNMTTKDISAITFQSVKSIQVARNRLRKRMGITRDENLVAALQQL
jgi:tetratricopeptide (TPR) repeat protein/DNA-binding CsgD family transcriptional regulator